MLGAKVKNLFVPQNVSPNISIVPHRREQTEQKVDDQFAQQCQHSSSLSNAANAPPCRHSLSLSINSDYSFHFLNYHIHVYNIQVKQKKKSSNKWTCALCNKNQSLRKVFAQGYQAKDIRIFVQSFNASRNSLQQQWLLAGTLNSTPEHALGDSKFPTDLNHNNKRTDWTAYLDNDDHHAANIAEQHGQFIVIFLKEKKNQL